MTPSRRLEDGAIILVLASFSGVLFPVIVAGDLPDGAVLPAWSQNILTNISALTYLIIFCILLARAKGLGHNLLKHYGLLALAFLVVASTLWSIDPSTTFRRAVGFGMSTVFGIYLGSQVDLQRLLSIVAWAMGICMLASAIFLVAVPDLGVMTYPHAGEWRGAFIHKNGLGQYATLNLLVLLALLTSSRQNKWLLVADAAFTLLLFLGSQSRTAFLVGFVLLAVLALVITVRRFPNLLIPFLPIVLGAGLLLAFNFEEALALFGRDLRFSGRLQLWNILWEMIETHWVLGYGFQAFWVAPNGPVLDLWSRLTWQPPNAHSGFLDIWLGVGIAGLAIFLAVFASAFARGWLSLRQISLRAGYWCVGYLTFFLLYGLDEINFLQPNGTCWILFVATVVLLNRGAAPRPVANVRSFDRTFTGRVEYAGGPLPSRWPR